MELEELIGNYIESLCLDWDTMDHLSDLGQLLDENDHLIYAKLGEHTLDQIKTDF